MSAKLPPTISGCSNLINHLKMPVFSPCSASMLAAVTTPHFLLTVDMATHTVAVLEAHRREYYGISWQPDGHDLILSHSGLDNTALNDLTAYAQSEVGWVSVGALDGTGSLSAPHQILVGSDGRIICTNTGRNSLLVLNPDAPGHFQEARLHPHRWDRLAPDQLTGLHINSLFERNGVLHVLAHGFQSGSRLIRLTYPQLTRIDDTPITGFTGMHNYCLYEGGEAVACASPQAMLIDPHTGRCLWASGCCGYLRGLAIGPSHLIVGESPSCTRAERATARSHIWVIDRHTWRAVDAIELGPYGVIHDIRLLDVTDEAHHGHPFQAIGSIREKLRSSGTPSRQSVEHESRLKACERFSAAVQPAKLEIIDGAAEVTATGHWQTQGGLCMLLLRQTAPDFLGLGYDFENAIPSAQCGLVFGLQPATIQVLGIPQVDTAEAVVVQVNKANGVNITHWTYDQNQWKPVQLLATLHGTVGNISLHRISDEIIVRAGEEGTVIAQFQGLRPSQLSGRWGIRWQGVKIVPETTPLSDPLSQPPLLPEAAFPVATRKLAIFVDFTTDAPSDDQSLQVLATRLAECGQQLESEVILATVTDHHANTVGLSSRMYEWESLDAETAARALAYAGYPVTVDHPALVPDDGIRHFTDCNLWVFLTPPATGIILPLRPFVMVMPFLPEAVSQLLLAEPFRANLRNAVKIIVFEASTVEVLMRELEIAHDRISLIEHTSSCQPDSIGGIAAGLVDLLGTLLVSSP